ncbi:TetR/AcrR family transcriptional regulator [Vallicoccus soli]|uniref:TetR/AcrR family transcriptional regulator n=1 Tax=Vallicoccus soli TaxID=2339232 RepID=A0A3A3Z9L2_9ACTN|nr:TetR/AcrR family transcriptional regulator [Vallicoccus soli]RJK97776.1 TetR/AcrR family transcriptional regulator [Vallicoccus soli]
MARAASGGGDPARTLALLWDLDPPSPRGPRQRLRPAQVGDAAVALADAQGLDAVTVRAVAAQLGVAPMTLYTYVPGRDELLDLMVDLVHREELPALRGGWRERAEQVARERLDRARRHPWLLEVATRRRPPLGPGTIGTYERELVALDGAGLSDVERDLVVVLLGDVADGAARGGTAAGAQDADWWAASGPLLERVLDPARYPRAVRVGAAAGAEQGAAYDPGRALAFALDRVLDGVAALVAGRPPA